MKIAIKQFEYLYHVGTLLQGSATTSKVSLEGHCLSVSEVPDEWRAIARLGGQPTWQLTKPKNQSLDVYRSSKKFRKKVEQWGIAEGLAVPHQGWQTAMATEDEPCFALSLSEEAAIATWGSTDDESGPIHRPAPVIVATTALIEYVKQPVELLIVPDMLLLAYADRVLGVDGVFWDDTLDVSALSAPRAGIFPNKLPAWLIVPHLA